MGPVMIAFMRQAWRRDGNRCSLSHSSRMRPSKLSTSPFCMGLPGAMLVPADLAILLPFQHRVRSQLRAVVRDHHARVTAQFGDTIQFAGDTCATDGCIDHGGQA